MTIRVGQTSTKRDHFNHVEITPDEHPRSASAELYKYLLYIPQNCKIIKKKSNNLSQMLVVGQNLDNDLWNARKDLRGKFSKSNCLLIKCFNSGSVAVLEQTYEQMANI
ncbi:hypothetical protein D917_07252 [Trichinella nativa]|uniref:Uncharacterized protein n=1 Tax=Trichinella nativa TaxID=6335 RepID=A0A1Y3EPF1_9BILA|nr:hypothetical protein D917_07252 [Trichinella nativa]